jgi:hypothetical protein
MPDPLVSVTVPAYNAASTVHGNAALCLGPAAASVIVVDDGANEVPVRWQKR